MPQQRKKRVLLVTEFSQLNTGFSVMANDLLTEMHKSGKYEIAEMASYVDKNHPGIRQVPWKVYPVVPTDPKELQNYHKNYYQAQFGKDSFEKVVLDFKPDIVFSYRDHWHDEWITKSPSRRLFNYVWSACIDSEPPKAEWIGMYSSVDVVTSYSDWGLNVLRKYSGNNTNIASTNVMPGVDQNIFKKMPKAEARAILGMKNDINIVLTVMRNQPRKLFPDLMYAFSKALEDWKAIGRHDLVDKTYLYLHTSYPDVGFDIGKSILRHKLASKVLMTYCCKFCGHKFASFFNGEVCNCGHCGNFAAHPPNTADGLSREDLAVVYNSADLYAQLSIAGALEIPLIEAKACGVPTIATDYAAMHEVSNLGGSYGLIEVAAWREEGERETAQIRASPNIEDCSLKIKNFFLESPETIDALSREAVNCARVHHRNETTYAKWDAIFDRLPMLSDDRWYEAPNKIKIDDIPINSFENDEDFIEYVAAELLPPKHSMRSFSTRKGLLTQLKSGVKNENGNITRNTRKDILGQIVGIAADYNDFEQFRFEVMNGVVRTKPTVEVV